MRIWSERTILDALVAAQSRGSATITLDHPLAARRFRTAIYNHLRRRRIPRGPLTITVSGCDVILHERRVENAILRASA